MLFFQVTDIASQPQNKDLFHQITDKNKLQTGTLNYWGICFRTITSANKHRKVC